MTTRTIPWLWCGVSACSFALANMKVEMFGTGEIDWPHFRFAWAFFAVGITGGILSTIKAAWEQPHPAEPPKVEVAQPADKPIPIKPAEPNP